MTCLLEPTPQMSRHGRESRSRIGFSANRYYDPTTDQFLSVDPKVAQTDQPYVFINDSPLNATDPLGLSIGGANGESCISLSACSNPSVRVRNQGIWLAASSAVFWAGVNAYEAMERASARQSGAGSAIQSASAQQAGSMAATATKVNILAPASPAVVGGTPSRSGIGMEAMRASNGCSGGASAESIIFGSSVAAASGGPGMVGYWMEAVGGATALTTGLETLGLGLLIGGVIFVVGGAVESLAQPSVGSC